MNMNIKHNAIIFPAQQTCATQLHLDGSMPRFSDMDWDSMRELKLATPYKPVASLPCIEATAVLLLADRLNISNKKGFDNLRLFQTIHCLMGLDDPVGSGLDQFQFLVRKT